MLQNDTRGSAFGGAILLMATITVVILTAAMFFGDVSMSSEQTELPEPDVEFRYTENPDGNEELLIRHLEGARVNPNQLYIDVSGASCTGDGEPNGRYQVHEDYGLAEDNWLAPGMALVVNDDNPKQMCESGNLKFEGATVSLRWESPDEEFKTIDRWSD